MENYYSREKFFNFIEHFFLISRQFCSWIPFEIVCEIHCCYKITLVYRVNTFTGSLKMNYWLRSAPPFRSVLLLYKKNMTEISSLFGQQPFLTWQWKFISLLWHRVKFSIFKGNNIFSNLKGPEYFFLNFRVRFFFLTKDSPSPTPLQNQY